MRTNRPWTVGKLTVSTPPWPLVLLAATLQVWPSFENWIWYCVANAASHDSTTVLNGFTAPRSTWSHDGSTAPAEAQRVVRSPSVALLASRPPPWVELAVAGWCSARLGPGGAMVSVAAALVTLPAPLLTTTVYAPASALWACAMVNTEAVARRMFAPLTRHWYVNGGEPPAMTEKLTGSLARTERLAGCCVMVGATAALTVRVAAAEVTALTGLVTTTV